MKIGFDTASAGKGVTTIRFIPRDQRLKIVPAVAEAEFSGAHLSLLHHRERGQLFVGLGERAKLDAHALRSATGAAAMFLKKIGHTRLHVDLEAWAEYAGPVVEGIVLADYRFERFKEKKRAAIAEVTVQVLKADVQAAKRAGARGRIVSEAANQARAVADEPGNLLYPATLAARAAKLGRGLKITVLDEKKLRARGFGGLLAVGGGSVRGPRLIVIEHRGGPKSQPPIALVGKAVTFDSGGISIKPAADMEEMIYDMCGGAAVLGAMAAIADLKLRHNVTGIIPSAENMPSATAYRPGDIVTTYDGKPVEIVNTDAEGRVVLADAIAFARRDCGAAAIIDLATLTGACGVALGDNAAGLWSSDPALHARVVAAAGRAGERVWPMPLFEEYEKQIESAVALIKNSGGRLGGACTAAAFLRVFAEKTPWAHLDIAYMSHRTKDRPDLARGATGYGVRLLVELVEQWSRPLV